MYTSLEFWLACALCFILGGFLTGAVVFIGVLKDITDAADRVAIQLQASATQLSAACHHLIKRDNGRG